MDVSEIVRSTDEGLEVELLVSPRSDRSGFEGVDEWRKRLVIRVKAPPLDGRANKEIEEYFKEKTKCKCEIIRGQTSRQKTIMIYGNSEKILSLIKSASAHH